MILAAVTAAGLGPALKGPGPFTVFAPNDAAFAKLPAGKSHDNWNIIIHYQGTVDALLKDIPKLTEILKYHVVSGKVRPTRNGKTYETLQGKEISSKVTIIIEILPRYLIDYFRTYHQI